DLHALRAVVEGTAAGIGREFFRSQVRHVAEAVGVPYAAVCKFDTPPEGRVLAFWDGDHVAEDLPFQFTTSPAAEVLHGRLAHFPPGVRRKFPRAAFLAERGIEATGPCRSWTARETCWGTSRCSTSGPCPRSRAGCPFSGSSPPAPPPNWSGCGPSSGSGSTPGRGTSASWRTCWSAPSS